MQKCEKCKTQFSWNQVYKSIWWNYKPIKCNNCEAKHKIKISGRFAFVSLTIVPMLIFSHFLSPFNNVFSTIGTGFCIIFIGSLLAPFIVKYRSSCDT